MYKCFDLYSLEARVVGLKFSGTNRTSGVLILLLVAKVVGLFVALVCELVDDSVYVT